MSPVPALQVAVCIERQKQPNPWEDWRHRLAEVLLDDGSFGAQPKLLRDDGQTALTLHPGLPVTLHVDEAEGYYLNLSTPGPVWFVLWPIDDVDPPPLETMPLPRSRVVPAPKVMSPPEDDRKNERNWVSVLKALKLKVQSVS